MALVHIRGNEAERLGGVVVADLHADLRSLLPSIVSDAVLLELGGIEAVVAAAEQLRRVPTGIERLIDEAMRSAGYEEARRHVFPELYGRTEPIDLVLGNRVEPCIAFNFAKAMGPAGDAADKGEFAMNAALALNLAARLDGVDAGAVFDWSLSDPPPEAPERLYLAARGAAEHGVVPDEAASRRLLREWGAPIGHDPEGE